MGTIERIRTEAETAWTSTFANGFTDGQAARGRKRPLSVYIRVGIDDYARGYRQGFFNRTASAAHVTRSGPRPLVRL